VTSTRRSSRIARSFFDRSPHGSKIEVRMGDAKATLAALRGETFDLVFLDADKAAYVDYYELAVPMLAPGGLLVADNALWSGRVLAPVSDDDRGVDAFNRRVTADPRVDNVLLSGPRRDHAREEALMLLAVDVGNTNISFGVCSRPTRARSSTCAPRARAQRTADEYAMLVRGMLELYGIEPKHLDAPIVASVVPALTDHITRRRASGPSASTALVVGPGIKTRHAHPLRRPARGRRRSHRQRGRRVRVGQRHRRGSSSSTSGRRPPSTA
jgi:hypothetical protein